jgi:hypothetical protein
MVDWRLDDNQRSNLLDTSPYEKPTLKNRKQAAVNKSCPSDIGDKLLVSSSSHPKNSFANHNSRVLIQCWHFLIFLSHNFTWFKTLLLRPFLLSPPIDDTYPFAIAYPNNHLLYLSIPCSNSPTRGPPSTVCYHSHISAKK